MKITPSNLPSPADYPRMGLELTEQYKRAVSGMVEVLKFGSMMMMVRQTIVENSQGLTSVRTRTQAGTWAGGDGLKAWLAEYAPEISRATAYRFLGVAEAVMQDYALAVGSKVAKQIPMVELVTAAPESLPPRMQAKQLELFSYVAGTSQRSWLDRFKGRDLTPRGGARPHPERPSNPNAVKEAHYTEELTILVDQVRAFVASPNLNYVDHAYRSTCAKALQDACKALVK